MKRLACIVSFTLALGSIAFGDTTAPLATPAIFFSDLTSGPNAGGKDNLGALVTIKGKNFGATQGSGYVTIGGGKAAQYLVWNDSTISFQLGSNAATGNIAVTTSQGTSNGIPFTVRSGNIYFVDAASPNSPGSGTFTDPWRSPGSFYSQMKAGDIYYFRAGTYSGRYGDSGANFNFGSSVPSGSLNNEIAFVGYPGENAQLRAAGSSASNNIIFGYPKNYFTIAGFQMYAQASCLGTDGTHLRFVNNSFEGLKTSSYGILHPVSGNYISIYGNEIFGATTGNKSDHPIYVGYGADNVDIGWNNIHNNDVAQGPVISINTDYAITNHYEFDNIRIHDNILDCRNSSAPLRAVGIVATDRGSSVYIYNNIIIEGGSTAVYQYSASSYIYNNVFYNSSGSAIAVSTVLDAGNDYRPETVDIKNNIFYNQSGCEYFSISNEQSMGSVTLDHNAYFGNGVAPARDTHAVQADPLFTNAAAGDFRLQANSPCRDTGVDTSSVAPTDKDGVTRPQGSAFDIGAYEYFVPGTTPSAGTTNPNQPPAASAAISGYLKDSTGAGIAGITVTLSGASANSVVTAQDGFYQFSNLQDGASYTVTPATATWEFEPASLQESALHSAVTQQNFTGSRTLYVKGSVKDTSGNPLSSATVTLTDDNGKVLQSTTSDNSGSYAFLQVTERSSYIVSTAKDGYVFTPASRATGVLSGNIDGCNFQATPLSSTPQVAAALLKDSVVVVGSASGKGTINPAKGDTAQIYFQAASRGQVECRIFTLTGSLVWEQSLNDVQTGSFSWAPHSIASGIYVVSVKGPGLNTQKKIAVVR